MNKYPHIISDKDILGCKPIIKGTRISVEIILEWIASGATLEAITESYPHLNREALKEAVLYAKDFLKNEILI